ncbi:hypothetical protein [Dongia sp.]|uniref:hypothetical protein n=1 Tax=Dongia sp. TaxID=1977262 RepID=UPI0035AD797E
MFTPYFVKNRALLSFGLIGVLIFSVIAAISLSITRESIYRLIAGLFALDGEFLWLLPESATYAIGALGLLCIGLAIGKPADPVDASAHQLQSSLWLFLAGCCVLNAAALAFGLRDLLPETYVGAWQRNAVRWVGYLAFDAVAVLGTVCTLRLAFARRLHLIDRCMGGLLTLCAVAQLAASLALRFLFAGPDFDGADFKFYAEILVLNDVTVLSALAWAGYLLVRRSQFVAELGRGGLTIFLWRALSVLIGLLAAHSWSTIIVNLLFFIVPIFRLSIYGVTIAAFFSMSLFALYRLTVVIRTK